MNSVLLMGNEAIALGAIRAGVSVASGYPGTPSTEILETLVRETQKPGTQERPLYIEWSVNEKAALELAAGAACSGARALVTMKQVGLNVASDPLMSLNYIGVQGGLVVVVADDPGPISSQTEQDTRHFGQYGKFAVFDPASPEEAYTMIADAFAYSEKYHRPVIFRPTTRICHSYASVSLLPDMPYTRPGGFDKAGGRWVIFPSLAYRNHIAIEADLIKLAEDFSTYPGNGLIEKIESIENRAQSALQGIAAGGVSFAYTQEALMDIAGDYKLLKVGTVPFPHALGRTFLRGLKEVLVIEELDPVIERELIYLCGRDQLPVQIKGKLSGDMPQAGEYTVSQITERLRAFLGVGAAPVVTVPEDSAYTPALPPRPPVLCAGCPHRGSFFAVKEAVREHGRGRKAVFSGDIGCYTLGNALPLDMVDTCLCMGAGITMAQGINRVEPGTLNIAFIGDSTFFHTGLPGLINGVYNQADMVVAILDNGTTAMTGNQAHPGMGRTATGKATKKLSIFDLVSALGVQELVRANAFDLIAAKQAVKQVLDKPGVRVILFEGPCIMIHKSASPWKISREHCTACMVCIKKFGCPAISRVAQARESEPDKEVNKPVIDPALCTGCGICRNLCAFDAIRREP
ncbi:MAG: indolepyruvate ferredoxin oxidoreductase subunit alpha [Treponema sp.]|jgi:indolepyruvate ferredoxin oxidoreductase alpha subunit|nr:indolepyruvate ferredoxin oxidoreductase subunit alpha [Treponema sp.]